jgi:hypothetical protein
LHSEEKSMLIPLFLCIGFMLAVLYIDLAFDISALPYGKNKAAIPREVLESITSYYRRVTSNPWLLMFVMTTSATCIIWEIVYRLVPPRIGYGSIVLFGVLMLISMFKVIPAAHRLASGKESEEKKIQLTYSLFPYHVALLIIIITLTLLQFSSARN